MSQRVASVFPNGCRLGPASRPPVDNRGMWRVVGPKKAVSCAPDQRLLFLPLGTVTLFQCRADKTLPRIPLRPSAEALQHESNPSRGAGSHPLGEWEATGEVSHSEAVSRVLGSHNHPPRHASGTLRSCDISGASVPGYHLILLHQEAGSVDTITHHSQVGTQPLRG